MDADYAQVMDRLTRLSKRAEYYMRKSDFHELTSSSSGVSNLTHWVDVATAYNDELDKTLEHYSSGHFAQLLEELAHNTTVILKTNHQMERLSRFVNFQCKHKSTTVYI